MELDELRVYSASMYLGECIWNLIIKRDFFAKDTVGKQLARSIDSVAANLSEGFGRYFYKEKKQFGYYSRGSLSETKTWITKAYNRKLISEQDYNHIMSEIKSIGISLNNYLNSLNTNQKTNSTELPSNYMSLPAEGVAPANKIT